MNTKRQNSILKSLFFSLFLCSAMHVVDACNVNASFTFTVDKNRTVTLTNNSTGANKYKWEFGDGNTSSLTSPVHQYNALGMYTILLFAYDTTVNGCFDTSSYMLDVPGCRIEADFTFKVMNNNEVYFTNYSEYYNSGFVQFYWNLGDGSFSTLKDPVHFYTATIPTIYTVAFIVYDTSLNNCSDTLMVEVPINVPCDTNDFTYQFLTDKKVRFVPKDTIGYRFSWSFGNGMYSDEKFPEVDFLYNGTYRTYLIFKKNKYRECIDSAIQDIEIKGCYVNSGYYIGRDTTNTYSGFIYNTSYTARPSKTSLMWYFGDGDSSSLWTPTHTYPGAGLYNLCLVVKDSTCTSTYCDTIGFDGNGQMLAMPFSIKIIDESNLTSLDAIKNGSNEVIIYPNPSRGLYQLQTEWNGTYTIINAFGKTVLNGNATERETIIDLSEFADGLYVVVLTDGRGQSKHIQLIKSN